VKGKEESMLICVANG